MPQRSGITLCFLQEDPDSVNKLYEKIVDTGYSSEKAPWDAFWGQRYCSVQDPNGNQVDIFANLSIDK